MNIKKQRLEIMLACENAKEKAMEIDNGNSHIIIKKMAKQVFSRVETIKKLCSVEKYNLFFNGKVAIGKSTAISSLMHLVDYENLKKGSRLSDIMLLKTGTGRITACASQIIPNAEKSKVIIEKVPYEEFKIFVEEFCKCINSDESDISEEGINLLKNMAHISLSMENDDIKKFILGENKNSDLCTCLLEKIKYDKRTQLEFEYNSNLQFYKWLKNTFEGLNDGQIETAPMPHKIIIYINNDDYEIKMSEFIKSIVDTRGIDGGERPDILKYISEIDSISLMCDEVDAYGGDDVLHLLKDVLIKEDKDTKNRVVLLGLERDKGLDSITGFEGNRYEGINKKKKQAIKKMTDNKISFLNDNFWFLDSAPGLEVHKKMIIDIHPDELDKPVTDFYDKIDLLLHKMYAGYYEELCDSLKTLSQLCTGKITESIIRKFEDCKQFILEAKGRNENNSGSIIQRFSDEILKIYHSSLRGTVNHWGIGNKENIYGVFQKCGGQEFINRSNVRKAEILVLVEKTFKDCTQLEEICFRSIVDEINDGYSFYYNSARDNFFNETYNYLYNSASWIVPKQYWGDGLGNYKSRVCCDILAEIKQKGIDVRLEQIGFETKYLEKILEFLDVS